MGANSFMGSPFNYPWKAAQMYPKDLPVLSEKAAKFVFTDELMGILKKVEEGRSVESVIKEIIDSYKPIN
jgi:hypothetical protein